MTVVNRSALLPYNAADMFDLVNDVAAYPQYMDGCVSAEVLEQSESHMVARLDLRKAGVSLSFATRNKLQRPDTIEMTLEDGPLSRLEGVWHFKVLREDACKVTLDLEFDVQGRLVGKAVGAILNAMAGNLVDALCKRAEQQYG